MRVLKTNALVVFTLVSLLALGMTGSAAFSASSGGDGYATSAAEYDLLAGQDEVAGKVYVWDAFGDVYVQYVAGHDWCILETHVEVASDASDIPQNRGGPIPGRFSQGESFEDCTTLAGHYIFPDAFKDDETVAVAAHAALRHRSDVVGTEPVTTDALTNAGAETGDMTGWSFTPGVVRAIDQRDETTGTVFPYAGEYFFDMTETQATTAFMAQSLAVPGFDAGTFKAGGWIQTELFPDDTNTGITENDYGELTVTFKDAAGTVLGTPAESGPIGNPVFAAGTEGYVNFEISGTVPAGAVSAEYRVDGTLVGGTFINVFVDDLYLDLDLVNNIYRTESAWTKGTRFTERGNWATYSSYEQGSGTLVDNNARELTFLMFDLGASTDDLGGMAWVDGPQQYVAHAVCAEVSGDSAWFTYQIPVGAEFAAGSWVTFNVTDTGGVGYSRGGQAAMVDLCENQTAISGGWAGTASGRVIVHPGS